MGLHYLAEKLGKTLGEIKAMPYSEYNSWKRYYKQLNDEMKREEEKSKGNLMYMDPNDIGAMFT